MGHYLIFFAAGLVAAAINSVAGGGTLISFPVLLALGLPSVVANATNSVGLWPGQLASAWGYRAAWRGLQRFTLWMTLPTLLGSLVGAWALVHTTETTFRRAVPGLILFAAVLFALQPKIKHLLRNHHHIVRHRFVGFVVQGVIAAYGGYFGAGQGILTLAVLGLLVDSHIHGLNGIKTWLGMAANAVAAFFFLGAKLVAVGPGLALAAGAVVGGWGGARLATRLPGEYVRRAVVVLGCTVATILAWRL